MLSRLELTLLEGEPDLTYLFKHIVTQEVAYESLTYAMRAMLHNQIGEYLEELFADERDQYSISWPFISTAPATTRIAASICCAPAERRNKTTQARSP